MSESTVVLDTTSGLTNTTLFFYLLTSVVALYWAFYRISNKKFIDLVNKIPGIDGVVFLGNALKLRGSAHSVFSTLWNFSIDEKFSKIGRIWVGSRAIVMLYEPNDVEVILGSQVHLDKAPEYRFFKPWLGDGLLISSGNHWRSHRKLIAPTFHLNVLKSFMTLFNRNARDACVKMDKHKGQEFDCHDYMSECTVETLLETAMGINKKSSNHDGYEYAMAVMKLCNIMHHRQIKPWLYPDFIFNWTAAKAVQEKLLNIIHTLTKNVIQQKKKEWATGVKRNLAAEFKLDQIDGEVEVIEKTQLPTIGTSFGQAAGLKDDLDVDEDIGEKKRVAFLDLMLESAQNGVVMNDNDIKEEVDTIMFEGHDTTAAGSSFFMCMMASHPEVQEKVIQEMDQIFGDSDRLCTFQDTLEMKYLERCLLETLRLYPPVPFIARQIKEDVKLPGSGYVLPSGVTAGIATIKLHRDPVVYPNPDKYDPDRFLPENCSNRHYYSFIPFSAGPRSCVGRKYAMLKLKVILSTIMRAYRIRQTIPESQYKLQADIILKRQEGFKVYLEPREGRQSIVKPLGA